MARRLHGSRIGILGGAVAVALTMSLPTAAHAGFFEQFFGGPQRSSQPSYGYDNPDAPRGNEPFMIQPRARVVRKAVDDKPVLQKTTDLIHDKTLRQGDAVMTKTGIKIFTGRETATHSMAEFTPLDNARRVHPA